MLSFGFALVLAMMPDMLGDVLPEPGNLIVSDRRVDIPNLPHNAVAFNPSMARYEGRLILIFRVDRFDLGWATQMQLGVVELSENFKVIRGPTLLDTRDVPWARHTSEDPRLIEHLGELYVFFNATHDGSMDSRRAMRVGRVHVPTAEAEDDDFEVTAVSELIPGEPGFRPWQEKNWSPFEHEGELHVIYKTNPPRIYRIDAEDLSEMKTEMTVTKVSELHNPLTYGFGEMRGGTPALFEPELGKYVSFFHSRHHNNYGGGFKMHYFIGFYTFDAEPPFAIDTVLPYPIIVPRMSNPAQPHLEVAYPGGVLIEDDLIYVCYGKNDRSIRMLVIDKERLYDVLAEEATKLAKR